MMRYVLFFVSIKIKENALIIVFFLEILSFTLIHGEGNFLTARKNVTKAYQEIVLQCIYENKAN